jgi:TRAP transporter TAXI family solute receptor
MIRRRTLLVSTTVAGAGLAAPAVWAQPRNPSWPRALTMGTAAPGGLYAVYGPAWGQLAAQATGVNISYRTTQGPAQNIVLVDQKQVELGMVTMGVALQAWEGTGEWTRGAKFRNIRALFPMYDTPFHAVALRRSGISNIEHMQGRSVGVGPRGGTPGTFWPLILRELNVTPSRIGFGSGSDLIGQVSDGLLDCFAFAAGVPVPAFSEIETTNEVTIFGFTEAQRDVIVKAMPETSKGEIPMGTYRSQTAPIKTVGMFNFAIGHKDLAEDLVYAIVKSIMTQNAAMVQAVAAAKETVPGNVTKNSFLPFHPGAARWFRENGFAIPDTLIMS